MTKKNLSLALVALALTLTGSSALATDCQLKSALSITAAGAAIDSSGTNEVRAQRARQRFKVSMDARVPDGTTFAVLANGSLAGTITIELGAGELELNNADGKTLPAGVNPVCAIRSIQVLDGTGNPVLQGSF